MDLHEDRPGDQEGDQEGDREEDPLGNPVEENSSTSVGTNPYLESISVDQLKFSNQELMPDLNVWHLLVVEGTGHLQYVTEDGALPQEDPTQNSHLKVQPEQDFQEVWKSTSSKEVS